MASQVCSRCRKRRIRCDRELPACKNCRLADVDCALWDESLGEEIPCSYLYSLQQKVQVLQLQVQQAADRESAASNAASSPQYEATTVPCSRRVHHLEIYGPDRLPSPSRTAYLGPGNAAHLAQQFLCDTAKWHLSNGIKIPDQLLPSDEPSHLGASRETRGPSSFSVAADGRKTDFHSLVPPSTQRAIIEHYIVVVAPVYALFPAAQVSELSAHENPLKWASVNQDEAPASVLAIVFAISTALITRDLDNNLAPIFFRVRDDVQKLSLAETSSPDARKWAFTSLCALALIELIYPTSGQLWDLLGRAASVFEELQLDRLSRRSEPEIDLRSLQRVLLQLESVAERHFRRPSLFLDTHLHLHLNGEDVPLVLSDDLSMAACLRRISHTLRMTGPPLDETLLESLIPLPFRASTSSREIGITSATLYMALHPLLTDVASLDGSTPSPRIVDVISTSACVLIDHYTKLNETNMIISLWVVSEEVLKAGVVWATAMVRRRRAFDPALQIMAVPGDPVHSLRPVVRISSLLSSMASRWKPGLAYVRIWEMVVELLWNTTGT